MGLLTGRLVRERGGSNDIPIGWRSVIEGQLPLTRLGEYSYIIGRALVLGETPHLQDALDHLACSQILHVGFQANGRWYSTAAVTQYAKSQIEAGLGRQLTSEEIRYLSGSVINTLDSSYRALLLNPYINGTQIEKLLFDVVDEGERFFAPYELEDIAEKKDVNINGIVKVKAALFWAQPDRGIFSRASRSESCSVIREFVEVDRWLAKKDSPNPLTPMLDRIESSQTNHGIFRLAAEQFSDFGDLLKEWERYEDNLFDLVNASAESSDSYKDITAWKNIQLSIRASKDGEQEGESDQGSPEAGTDVVPVDEMATSASEAQFVDAATYLDTSFDSVLQEPPAPTKPSAKEKSAAKVGKPDYEAKAAESRELGCAGELFVVEYERTKLRNAGKPELANKVEWVSKEIGDGLGYDIASFEADGSKIQIEVKTTKAGKATPFIISSNELSVWREKQLSYRLYRLYSFSKAPKLYVLSGDPDDILQLDPISYRARV